MVVLRGGQDRDNRAARGFEESPWAETEAEREAALERLGREAPYYPSSRREAWQELVEDAGWPRRIYDRLYITGVEALAADGPFQRRDAVEAMRELDPETANERYGVEGYLTFDGPVAEIEAANRQVWARRQAYRERAVATSELPWLDQLGAGLLGSVLDPLQLPLWVLAPEAMAGNFLRNTAFRSLPTVGRFAAAGSAEGVIGGTLFEAVNLPLRRSFGEDYGLGDASMSVLGGGLFGAALGVGGGVLARAFEGPAAARPPRPPREIRLLRPETRVGAAREALEAVIEDRPVDLGPRLTEAVEWAGAPEGLARLDEGEAFMPQRGWRLLEPDVAVTTRGTEIPVRYALVELDSLITSHDDDLFRTFAYPAELQPRQRERAPAQARNRALEAELNPRRLTGERGAESGAPIVSTDGVVESGNGRTIALRRSANGSGTDAYARYRAHLEAEGHDLRGFDKPVLVRVRTEQMTGEQRVALTREMNADVTERYSATEQAMADAGTLDDATLALMDGSEVLAASNRAFVRKFIETVAPDQMNAMITPGGGLSKVGIERVRAALTAKAYADEALVETLFEAGDDTLKGIGRALADAAPDWAAMRGAMARGEVPAELDMTANLKAAVDFVRHARQRKIPLADLVAQRLGQLDAFSGEAVSPETEAFLRAMFQTDKDGATMWNRPRAADKIAEGLRWLAGEARKVEPGPNLFGEVADATDARRLLDGLAQFFARQGEPDQHPLAFADPEPAAGGNVRSDGGQGAGGRGRPEAGEGAGRPGEGLDPAPAHAEGPRLDIPDPLADPELRALRDDTEALIRREGLELGDDPRNDPDVIAAGVRAGAECMVRRL